jgi:hypothetical protein
MNALPLAVSSSRQPAAHALCVVVISSSSSVGGAGKNPPSVWTVVDDLLSGHRRMYHAASTSPDGVVPASVIVCDVDAAQNRFVWSVGGNNHSLGKRFARDGEDPCTSRPLFQSAIASYGLLQHNAPIHAAVGSDDANGSSAKVSASIEGTTAACENPLSPPNKSPPSHLRSVASALLRAGMWIRRVHGEAREGRTSSTPSHNAVHTRSAATGGTVVVLVDDQLDEQQGQGQHFVGDVALSSAVVALSKLGATVHVAYLPSASPTSHTNSDATIVHSRLHASAAATGGHVWLSFVPRVCLMLMWEDDRVARASLGVDWNARKRSEVATRYVVTPPLPYVRFIGATTGDAGGVQSKAPKEACLLLCPQCMVVLPGDATCCPLCD